jgi:hypothetical protein
MSRASARGRSRMTNQPVSAGRYGSSKRAVARRVRDLYRAHLARLGTGPHDAVTEACALRAAELAVICEALRAKAVAGEEVSPDAITRLEGTRDRAERAMIKGAPADAAADAELNEILSQYQIQETDDGNATDDN